MSWLITVKKEKIHEGTEWSSCSTVWNLEYDREGWKKVGATGEYQAAGSEL